MHVVVTGAEGFVGAALAQRLIARPDVLGAPITRLTLIDRRFRRPPESTWVRLMAGSFADPRLLDAAFATPVDLLFHLASVPGSLAERDYALGHEVNLFGSIALAERLADLGRHTGLTPRLVFASSIAVYGAIGPHEVSEDAAPRPALSYGAHKLMTEILLADLARRGDLDARSVRLPGIVARPPNDSGHGSAFMSLIFHKLAAGEPYDCPVSRDATAWWMSLDCCVDNLLHAARLQPGTGTARTWQLPVLRLSVGDIVDRLSARFGAKGRGDINYERDPRIENLFGRLPPLAAPEAEAAGFHHDGNVDALIDAVLVAMAGRPKETSTD